MLRELRQTRRNLLQLRWKFLPGTVRCAISQRKNAAPVVAQCTIAALSIKGRTGRIIKMFAIHSKYVLRAYGKIYYYALRLQSERKMLELHLCRSSPKCSSRGVGMITLSTGSLIVILRHTNLNIPSLHHESNIFVLFLIRFGRDNFIL